MENIRRWINNNKSALIVGLVTSLIWQGFIFFAGFIPQVGPNILKNIDNLIYFKAATMSSDYMLSQVFSMILGIFIGGATCSIFIFLFDKADKLFKKIKKQSSNKLDVIPKREHNSLIFPTVCFIMLSILFGTNMVCYNLKMRFDLDMTSIKPYILEQEFNKLNSDWTQMKNKDDYKSIYNEIDIIQEQNQLDNTKKTLK